MPETKRTRAPGPVVGGLMQLFAQPCQLPKSSVNAQRARLFLPNPAPRDTTGAEDDDGGRRRP